MLATSANLEEAVEAVEGKVPCLCDCIVGREDQPSARKGIRVLQVYGM